ncbi:MAG: hypothetical protein OXR73_28730 [Myxococcales bacterium]|nr:hypothetical protein [Myxococcales bacterium]
MGSDAKYRSVTLAVLGLVLLVGWLGSSLHGDDQLQAVSAAPASDERQHALSAVRARNYGGRAHGRQRVATDGRGLGQLDAARRKAALDRLRGKYRNGDVLGPSDGGVAGGGGLETTYPAPQAATRWATEQQDAVWSDETREHLDGVISDMRVGARLQTVDCRTTLCMVEVAFDGPEEARRLWQLASRPDEALHVLRLPDGEGEATAILYLERRP